MSLKLRNRKAAEAQLGQFVEDISLPPKLISAIVEGEVRLVSTGLLLAGSLTCAYPRRTKRTCSTSCSCTISLSSPPQKYAPAFAPCVRAHPEYFLGCERRGAARCGG